VKLQWSNGAVRARTRVDPAGASRRGAKARWFSRARRGVDGAAHERTRRVALAADVVAVLAEQHVVRHDLERRPRLEPASARCSSGSSVACGESPRAHADPLAAQIGDGRDRRVGAHDDDR